MHKTHFGLSRLRLWGRGCWSGLGLLKWLRLRWRLLRLLRRLRWLRLRLWGGVELHVHVRVDVRVDVRLLSGKSKSWGWNGSGGTQETGRGRCDLGVMRLEEGLWDRGGDRDLLWLWLWSFDGKEG